MDSPSPLSSPSKGRGLGFFIVLEYVKYFYEKEGILNVMSYIVDTEIEFSVGSLPFSVGNYL